MDSRLKENKILADLAASHHSLDTPDDFKKAMIHHLYHSLGQGIYTANPYDIYHALALTIRDELIENWRRTVELCVQKRPKWVYYLSAEYLPGQQITQNLLYSGKMEIAREAVADFGLNIDQLIALEPEPALGNGGMGRLASCYMDSIATLNIPCVAYGIHYEFGIFKQAFKDGWQVESPNEWLYYGNPWEFPQTDNRVEVGFGGHTEHYADHYGALHVRWHPAETILGEPSHMLVPGYQTGMVNMLRLWRAKASREFDFSLFNTGDYARAAEQKILSENISKVLYPNDNTYQGRELRLKQEYFFVSCSVQDILRRFRLLDDDWDELPNRAVIQLNDTHPVMAIPEMMRLLIDVHELGWDQAWRITSRTFAYTCHTLMPEALEKWPVGLFERLLPRHLEIIYEINRRFLDDVRIRFHDDPNRVTRISIIEEGQEKMVRMAYLAAAVGVSVNGVADLHTQLLKQDIFTDFSDYWPEKLNNKTNGVSPRRFIRLANPGLSQLITTTIGEGWIKNLEQLSGLEAFAGQEEFQFAWRQAKRQNKILLASVIAEKTGILVDQDSMFDVMVKRLHEYKRQLLKILHIITIYNRIKVNPHLNLVPRTYIFGAKAAPGYHQAKLIIKLINSVADVVNRDPDVCDRLKVVFLPNFNVTLAERIYPAADLSEQISTAGKEASGTGNMKFALNGAVTIGTLDGANVEIRERVGAENFFLFGLTTDEIVETRLKGYRSAELYYANLELKAAVDRIASGYFARGDQSLLTPLVNSLLSADTYLLCADYPSFIQSQDKVDKAYRDIQAWTRMSILNSARCGFFSSDRAIQQYCDEIWGVTPLME